MKLLAILFMSAAIAPAVLSQQTQQPQPQNYGGEYQADLSKPAAYTAPSTGPRCPWMNLGTAAGFVGGAVKLELSQNSKGQVEACRFTRIAGDARIEVKVTPNSTPADFSPAARVACPAQSTALRAIGNEAVECSSQAGAVVAGRVRDQIFTVRLELPGGDAPVLALNAHDAAELVAGNLF